MAFKEYKELKIRKKRKKLTKKQQRRRHKIKKGLHNLFSFTLLIFIGFAAYFLFWGLIIEPNIPRHVYGPGDFKEFIYLLTSIFFALISYFIILLVHYKPLNMRWWSNLKLLWLVRFNMDKYSSMKNMGINYIHHKKRSHHKSYYNQNTDHKSITE